MATPIHPGLFTPEDDPRGPRLLAGRCTACGDLHFPRAEVCPYCGCATCSETAIGATGTIYVGTVVTTAPPGYQGSVPYGFGLVDLDEGLRVISVLGETDPEKLTPGTRCELAIRPVCESETGDPALSWLYIPRGGTK